MFLSFFFQSDYLILILVVSPKFLVHFMFSDQFLLVFRGFFYEILINFRFFVFLRSNFFSFIFSF